MNETRISPFVKWTILAVASVGFLFDIYEILVGPLVLQPALGELAGLKPGTQEYRDWAAWIFWIPPVTGGLFGLLGGYLADLFGRRRVLVWSILLYTAAALSAGMSTSLPMLLVFRALTFVGVCVEFVAAVAWLAELFPEPREREAVLGGTQAFSSLGGVLTAGVYYVANHYGELLPAIHGAHSPWRYTLIGGLIPAIPLMLIRPWLPESPEWQRKKLEGTLKRPSLVELFRPGLRKTTIVTTLMFACAYGAAFGSIQQSPQMTPGLKEVAAMTPSARGEAVSSVQSMQETGGLLGRIVMAGLALVIVSRRALLRLFLIPGFFITAYVFTYSANESLSAMRVGIFCAGFTTVALLTFWGNYLPRVFPVHLRGTGEGLAANVGGRMMGTFASYIVTHLSANMPGSGASTKLAYAAAIVGSSTYVIAFVLSFFMPEPGEAPLE